MTTFRNVLVHIWSNKEGYHIEMVGEKETGESGKRALPPSLVFEPPPEEGRQEEAGRLPKTSLPARMSDLYQVTGQLQQRIT